MSAVQTTPNAAGQGKIKSGTDLAIKTRPVSRVAPKTDFFRSCRILEQKRLSRERFLRLKRKSKNARKERR